MVLMAITMLMAKSIYWGFETLQFTTFTKNEIFLSHNNSKFRHKKNKKSTPTDTDKPLESANEQKPTRIRRQGVTHLQAISSKIKCRYPRAQVSRLKIKH